jgi:hypothetical protein
VRIFAICLIMLAVGCGRDAPQAPTAAETEQLDDAESMLNALANEEGPEADAPDPSNQLQ